MPPHIGLGGRPHGRSYSEAKVGQGLPKILEISISGLPKKAKNLEICISGLAKNLEQTTGLPKLLDLTPPMGAPMDGNGTRLT